MINIRKFIKGLRILNETDQSKNAELVTLSNGDLQVTTLTKNVIFNGNAIVIPILNFNPLTPPTGVKGALVFNDFDDIPYIHTGITYAPINAPVLSVNGQTGVVVLDTDDITEGIVNLYFTNSRAQAAVASDLANKANVSLDNLASTAVNANILPATTETVSLGTLLLKYVNVFARYIKSSAFSVLDLSDVEVAKLESYTAATPSGDSAASRLIGIVGNVLVQSANDAVANSTDTGKVLIESGNKLAGTGDSGDISIRTGSSVGGVRGNIVNDSLYEIHSKAGVEVAKDFYFKDVTLTAGATDAVISSLTFPLNTFQSATVKYMLTDSASSDVRIGELFIAVNLLNNSVGFSDVCSETSIMPIVFDVAINAGNIEIKHTNTLTGPTLNLSGKFTMFKV